MALMFIIGCVGVLLMAYGGYVVEHTAGYLATVAGSSLFTAALLCLIN